MKNFRRSKILEIDVISAVLSDPALFASSSAFQATDVARALAPFFGDTKLQHVEARVLRHRPGRRALLAYAIYIRGPRGGLQRRIVFAKAYRSKRASRVFDVLRQAHAAGLTSSGRFRTPAPIALFADWHVVVYERMPGAALNSTSDTTAFARTGSAITAFHASQMHFEEVRTPEEEIADAEKWLRDASVHVPELLATGESVLRGLYNALSSLESVLHRPLHRDFYPAQVIIGKVPAFIDLDYAAMGDPAIDVGNFLAHLYLFPARVQRIAANAFCSALSSEEALPWANVKFYEATSLVRIAGVHAVRYGRTRLASRLLREAQQLLF